LTKLSDKRPKIPPLCIDVIKEGVIAFGAKVFPIKEIIAGIVAVLNGSNGGARESSFSLMIEMTRWIGRVPFNAMLENIRSAQKTEFEKLF
jgi:cytoskeleton-associated protein 5